jgi:hypothetical protein
VEDPSLHHLKSIGPSSIMTPGSFLPSADTAIVFWGKVAVQRYIATRSWPTVFTLCPRMSVRVQAELLLCVSVCHAVCIGGPPRQLSMRQLTLSATLH